MKNSTIIECPDCGCGEYTEAFTGLLKCEECGTYFDAEDTAQVVPLRRSSKRGWHDDDDEF